MKYKSKNKTFKFVDSLINPNHMTDNQIVIKAIKKAIKNKGEFKWKDFYCIGICEQEDDDIYIEIAYDVDGERSKSTMCEYVKPEEVIFCKGFAKALWGDFYETPDGFTDSGWPKVKQGYRYHLQKLVLEEDKTSYLEKFLK